MDHQNQIYLSDLQGENITFWSAGNYPTQVLYGLSASEVLAHLRALHLLCDKVLGAGSFYLESDITREVTDRLEILFKQGDILYFVDESKESFAEHAAKKREKSPKELMAYRDKTLVQERAKRLDSFGHILRRPDYSISDKIVELWIRDIHSRDVGTSGECLSRLVEDEGRRLALQAELTDSAKSREKDFVWEYLDPKLIQLGLPEGFRRIARRRLAQMYSAATLELLGVSLDRPEHALPTSYITTHSRFDTSLFLGCMEVLGVRRCFFDDNLTPTKLLALKTSPEFICFREFYFELIEVTAYRCDASYAWLTTYRDAVLRYSESLFTTDDFLQAFKALCRARGKPPRKYTRPLELLLSVYDSLNRLTIEDFIDKMISLSDKQAVTNITLPKAPAKPFKPEPTLSEEEYENVLKIVYNMALVMERSPQTFSKLTEEEIRDHFLMHLNGHYQGRATGETFNHYGKTDILIRVEGKNIFIAECKFWKGQKRLHDTIDQLLGYTSWRDTKTSILLFNRTRGFSSVLNKIDSIVKTHGCYKREHRLKSTDLSKETTFSYIFHQASDKNRELVLTVVAFNIPP